MYNSHDQYRSPRTLSLLAIAGIGVFAFCQIGSAIIGVAQIAGPAKTIKLDAETETSIWMALQGLIAAAPISGLHIRSRDVPDVALPHLQKP